MRLSKQRRQAGTRIREPGESAYYAFTIPSLILYSLVLIVPILLGFYYSTTNWNGISPTYEQVGLENFLTQITDKTFHYSLRFTLAYTVNVVLVIVVIGFFTAVFLNYFRSKLKTLYKTLLFFPALIAPIVVSLIFKQIYAGVLPWLGQLLGLEFLSKNLMGNMDTLRHTIEYVHMWYGMAVPVVLYTAGLQMVPEEIYDASRIDGANFFQRLWHIIIPYMVPIINIVFILTLKHALMVYDIIMGLTTGGPGTRTNTLSVYIYREAFNTFRLGYATSVSITVFFIMLVIAAAQMKLMSKKDVNAP